MPPTRKALETYIHETFGNLASRLSERLTRACYEIAPLDTSTGNTRIIKRWELPANSPHFATQKACSELERQLLSELQQMEHTPLTCFLTGAVIRIENIKASLEQASRIGRLEIPLDYQQSLRDGGHHETGNLCWIAAPL
jgi:hypothetical protein